MNRERFVVDTNVLISAALVPGTTPDHAIVTAIEHGILLFSDTTIAELKDVLMRPKFDQYASVQRRAAFITKLLIESETVAVTTRVLSCRDPNDDKFLEVAINGNATCVVSGDDDLLVLNPFRGIPILTPRSFLETERITAF